MVDINQENSKIVIVSTAIVIFMDGVGNAILIYEMLVSVCLYVCLCVCYAELSAFLTLFDYHWNQLIAYNFTQLWLIQQLLCQYQHFGYQTACTQAVNTGDTFTHFYTLLHTLSCNFHAISAKEVLSLLSLYFTLCRLAIYS